MKILECERLSFFWWTVGQDRLLTQSSTLINTWVILEPHAPLLHAKLPPFYLSISIFYLFSKLFSVMIAKEISNLCYRMSSIAEMGLYDTMWEKYHTDKQSNYNFIICRFCYYGGINTVQY